MKVVILAGGLGSRLAEETVLRPKPMVEIGGQPILWHIMNIFANQGFHEFIIALGYKSVVIKDYFINFYARTSNLSIDLSTGETTFQGGHRTNWKVHLIDTGQQTLTGGRLKRLAGWLGADSTFMLTYGDGVADIDLGALVSFHRSHGRLATITSVQPPARFGSLVVEGNRVTSFAEKTVNSEGFINGGFFVLERGVLDYIDGDQTSWERQPLERLAADGQLMAYRHAGFWQPMDTLRDRHYLEELWAAGAAPWKNWNEQ